MILTAARVETAALENRGRRHHFSSARSGDFGMTLIFQETIEIFIFFHGNFPSFYMLATKLNIFQVSLSHAKQGGWIGPTVPCAAPGLIRVSPRL